VPVSTRFVFVVARARDDAAIERGDVDDEHHRMIARRHRASEFPVRTSRAVSYTQISVNTRDARGGAVL
jgi:hypothetical protein